MDMKTVPLGAKSPICSIIHAPSYV